MARLLIIVNLIFIIGYTSDAASTSYSESYATASESSTADSAICPERKNKAASCGINEELSKCVQAVCRAQNCTQKYQPIPYCPAVDKGSCKQGCVCKQGFLRDDDGECISENECKVCPSNEEFSNCTQALCRAQNCTQKDQLIACPGIEEGSCQTGCICVKGTLRNSDGICVPEDQCPALCGDNEVLTNCPRACAPVNCPNSYKEEQEKLANCVETLQCRPSECRCKPNYRRDETGKCIFIGKCPGICSTNEEFSDCTQALCRAQNCTQSGQKIACPAVAEGSCTSGCVCKKDTLRDNDGNCVPEDQCPGDLVCGENEIISKCPNSGYGDYCPKNEKEAKLQKIFKAAPKNCDAPACVCRFNNKRDNNGKCVSTRNCPPFTCSGKNEEFQACPPYCPSDDCSQATPTGKCPRIGRIGIVVECKPDCRCIPGYWRKNKVCVPYAECPGKSETCPSNEEFSNCTQALCRAQNCTQSGKEIACLAVAEGSCTSGCVCKEGTLRDENGNCVPENKCPASCGKNEVLMNCPTVCAPVKCPKSYKEEQEKLANCIETRQCRPSECRCKPNYRRDETGKCIFIGKCPGICSTNEEFSDCTQALCRAQNCTQSGQKIACPAVAEGSCTSGCVCKNGTLRDNDGNCVPEDQCPGDLVCGENEIISKCPNSGYGDYCPKNEKEAKLQKISKAAPENCDAPACVCGFNSKRDDSGKCIPTRECPPFTCSGKNEEFQACPPYCPSDDCSQATPTGKCPVIGRIGIVVECKPDCRCIPGYWRKNKVCVPYEECPGNSETCPSNEEFSNCTQALCRAQNCTQKGQPIACPRIKEGSCQTGCVCVKGTLRNSDGICVPEDQCPALCGDNEVLTNCPRACAPVNCPNSYKKEQEKLANCFETLQCRPSECRCKPNHRRDETGKCIFIGKCPGICSTNEEFSDCTQALCRAQNCTQSGQKIACPAVAEGSCTSGCVCKNDTLRDNDGNCVPEDQCPGDLVCGENEIISKCPNSGYGDYCPKNEKEAKLQKISKAAPENCDAPACVCGFNSKRDDSGKCIPTRECPPFTCSGKNEEFQACPPYCPSDDCSQATPTGKCPVIGRIGIVVECKPDCRCIPGYWRKNKVCVPYEECPGKSETCPSNEEFSNCTQALCRAQNCTQKGQPIACPKIKEGSCQTGCVCVKGTLRNSDGICVPEDQCPASCGRNEELSKCVQAVCRAQNCTQKYQPKPYCPAVAKGSCKQGCVCKQGFLRNDNGECISESECKVCPAYEEYSNCTQAVCRMLNCSQQGQPLACPRVAKGSCKRGCVCQSGYLRTPSGSCVPQSQCYGDLVCEDTEIISKCPNPGHGDFCPKSEKEAKLQKSLKVFSDTCAEPACVCRFNNKRNENGKCIPTRDCPPFTCSGKNEEYNSCPPYCPTDDCSQATPSGKCPLIGRIGIVLQCKPDCRCIPGYWRKNKVCVPYEECPGKSETCPSNEEFSNCTQALCRAQNCTQKGQPIACPGIEEGSCRTGCVCVKGTLRNSDGLCVPEDQCPAPQQPQCNENEVLSCVHPCPPERTCRNRLIQFSCVEPTKKCESKCICKPGLFRNSIGQCISGKECDQCQKPNEFFSCGQMCDNECSTLGTQNRTNCPFVNIVCNRQCYCDDGYARNENKECVPIEKCPKRKTCKGLNEEYVSCKQTCPPELCRSITARYDCSKEPPCQPGCACKSGFFRQNQDSPCKRACDCDEMKSSSDCLKKCD